MQSSPENRISERKEKVYPIFSVTLHPGSMPETYRDLMLRQKAVVIVTNAMGSGPERFLPLMRELKSAHIPIFLLPDSPRSHHGVIRIVERPQTRMIEAGGIPLEKANINNHPEVIAAIQEELDAGKEGDELADAITKRFAYKDSEPRPISPLGTEEGFAKHAQRVRGHNPEDDMY